MKKITTLFILFSFWYAGSIHAQQHDNNASNSIDKLLLQKILKNTGIMLQKASRSNINCFRDSDVYFQTDTFGFFQNNEKRVYTNLGSNQLRNTAYSGAPGVWNLKYKSEVKIASHFTGNDPFGSAASIESANYYFWDGSAWVNGYQISTPIFTPNGYPQTQIFQIWNGINWRNYTKHEYTYDAATTKIINEVESNWDSLSSSWMFSRINSITLDNAGDTLSYYFRSNSDTSNYIYTYNVSGQKISDIYQRGNPLQNQSKSIYSYVGGQRVAEFGFSWDRVNSAWSDTAYRISNTYNINGMLTTSLREGHITPGIWQPYFRQFFSYDNNNNLTKTINQSYNSFDVIWETKEIDNYSYDANNQIKKSAHYQTLPNGNLNRHLYSDSTIYYGCNAVSLSIADVVEDLQLKIYPNPSSDILHITLNGEIADEIRIYNFDGSLVSKNEHSNNINIANLITGLYVVEVEKGKLISRLKWQKI